MRRDRAAGRGAVSPARPRVATVAVEFVPRAHARRAWAIAAGAIVLLWALVFFPHLFLGQRVVFGDSSYYRPFADFSRARWQQSHERTYWNPYVFMGLESVSSFADSRPQYLPGPLIDLTERLHEPAGAPQLWLLLAHLCGALSLMALARRLWGVDPWSGAIAAVLWLFAVPVLGPFAHGFDAQLLADAMTPVVLLGTQLVISARGARAPLIGALGLALAIGLQCLHGHPQILVYSSMLALAFALQQAWERRRFARLLGWGGAVALGVAIGAAVWFPALFYSAASSRSGAEGAGVPMAIVTKYSYTWRDLLSLVWAQAVGFGRATYWGGMQIADDSPYLGAAAAALAFAGFGRARGSGGSRFWWSILAAGVLLSLGASLGPLFEMLRGALPFWSQFRAVSYVILWSCLALALLAARGASRATVVDPAGVAAGPSRTTLMVLGGVGVLGLAIACTPLRPVYLAWALALRPGIGETAANAAATWAGLELLALAALVALVLWMLANARRGRGWARPVLVLLVAVDLAAVSGPNLWRSSGPPSAVAPPPPPLLARLAAAMPHTRVYVGAAKPVQVAGLSMGHYVEAYTNFWISWRVRTLAGNHGAFPGAWEAVIESGLTRSARVLRAWGVEWYDVDAGVPPPPGTTPAGEDARSRVSRLPAVLGRAYAAQFVVALPDRPQLVAAMQSPEFDPALVAVTLDAAAAGAYPGSRSCKLRWVRDDPERLELDVDAPDRAFVVVADSNGPGWTASVDGHRAPIRAVDLMVRGVAVPAGRHRLVMVHVTPGIAAGTRATRWGLAIWLLVAVAVAVAGLVRRRGAVLNREGPA